jgi:general secretion pathway protein I
MSFLAPRGRRSAGRRGFTLLEVLVAVAILGIGLTAIFSTQWVSFASVRHTRYVNEGTGLARCKMSEIEWDLTQNGYQLTDVNETGPCCDAEEKPGITCSWRVEKPEFPKANFGELNLDSELDLGSGGPSLIPGIGSPGGVGEAPGAGALGFLKMGASGFKDGGDVSDIADSVMGGADGVVDGIAAMVMQIVYPELKAIFEAGTRKVTVKVAWYEGSKEYSIELEQWVTNAKEAGLNANLAGLIEDGEGGGDSTSTTSGGPPPKEKR